MTEQEKKTLLSFDDDQAFIGHIMSQEIPKELVEVPEWNVTILCQPPDAAAYYILQQKAFDEESQRYNYNKVFYELLMEGCCNPATGGKVFHESQRTMVMRYPVVVQRLAAAVLKLSNPGAGNDSIKKN